jgi:hypothetical protein
VSTATFGSRTGAVSFDWARSIGAEKIVARIRAHTVVKDEDRIREAEILLVFGAIRCDCETGTDRNVGATEFVRVIESLDS